MRHHLIAIAFGMSVFLASEPAAAQNNVIVRDTGGLTALQNSCVQAG